MFSFFIPDSHNQQATADDLFLEQSETRPIDRHAFRCTLTSTENKRNLQK